MSATLPGNVALPSFVYMPDPWIYVDGKPLFLDFETTNLDKGSARNKANRIVLACWQEGWDGEPREKWGGEFDQTELVEAIARCDFLVAHNAKFELAWLARCGVNLENVVVYDTMLAEYVIGGNRWKTAQLSLERCGERHGLGGKHGIVSRMIKAGIPTENIPRQWLLRYCHRDVALMLSLMKSQISLMTSGTRLLPVVYNRCLLTPVLADIEQNGMKLDGETLLPLTATEEAALLAAEIEVNKLAEGVNLNSPKQKAAFLYDKLKFEELEVKRGRQWVPLRTPSGGRRTDGDTIDALVPKTKEQREFKELYENVKVHEIPLTKYLRKFKACIDEAGGILYASFNQAQTATHRLSSSGAEYKVQFQNFPRAFKKYFRATQDGWLVGEVDGSQLEFRAAGHLGRDVAILADVVSGVDVHAFTASTITEHGQETDRQTAKTHTFKPLYGGQSGTEAEQAYYAEFKARYPGIAEAQRTWIDHVLTHKQLETEWGLVYYWPDTKMSTSGYISNTPSISNYPVQGFATAELIPMALVCMWHRIKRLPHLQMRIVNTVHDSIAAEFPPEETETFHELCKQTMIYDADHMAREVYGIELFVPLGCGVKVGERWGSGKETKYEKENNN